MKPVFPLFLASAVLLSSCVKTGPVASALQPFVKSKSVISEVELFPPNGGKPVTAKIVYSKELGIQATGSDGDYAFNKIEGSLELSHELKQYDISPVELDGGAPLGRVGPRWVSAARLLMGDDSFAKIEEKRWKKSTVESDVNRYTALVENPAGPSFQVSIEIDESGSLKSFVTPQGIRVKIKSAKFDQPVTKETFAHNIPDGYSEYAFTHEIPSMPIGAILPLKKFSVEGPVGTGASLICVIDPNEEPSKAVIPWLVRTESRYAKVALWVGGMPAGLKGYSDPKRLSDTITEAYPTFFLIDDKQTILAIWHGFDAEKPREFEADVVKALDESKYRG